MKISPFFSTVAALVALPLSAQAQIGWSELKLNAVNVTLIYPTDAVSKKTNIGSFELDVAVQAPIAAGAPRRLIVMSHGAGGSVLPDHTMAATFARAGFIVAQPLHEGDNFRDSAKSGPAAWVSRPAEISTLIDGLSTHPQWRSVLQLDRVGVHGMSAGGATSITLAGGRWRLLSLLQHCSTNFDIDAGFCFNGMHDPVAQAQRKAQYLSVKGVPEIFLPATLKKWNGGNALEADPRADRRIASVTATVPVAAIFSEESLARIKVPVGIVAAEADTMLKPAFHSDYVIKHCNACALLDSVPGASHLDMLHPWPVNVAAQTALTQPLGAEVNINFDAARRSAAYARIVDFHSRHLSGAN
jgi:predicted dienelactone hydrolase